MVRQKGLPAQSGIIHFLPLLFIAVLLIGFIGYVSIKKYKSEASTSDVLSDTSQTNTDQQLNEDFGNEDKGLNEVGDLEVDLPDLKITPIPSVHPETNQKPKPTSVSFETTTSSRIHPRKLLGSFEVNISDDSFFVKYLDFLFK
jgi:hypothetical protein